MILCFKLSMPNVGSWNGKWSGQNKQYLKIVNLGRSKKGIEKAHKILNKKNPQWSGLMKETGHYYHNFGDGWGAGIDVYVIDGKEAVRLRRQSAGFCGYDWMVDSIVSDFKIIAPSSRNN